MIGFRKYGFRESVIELKRIFEELPTSSFIGVVLYAPTLRSSGPAQCGEAFRAEVSLSPAGLIASLVCHCKIACSNSQMRLCYSLWVSPCPKRPQESLRKRYVIFQGTPTSRSSADQALKHGVRNGKHCGIVGQTPTLMAFVIKRHEPDR